MRPCLVLATLTLLAGCSNEYSRVPEPSGAWVPANPPSLVAQPASDPAPRFAGRTIRLRQAQREASR